MKKIFKSLMMISAVAALAIGGTVAYFSDEEVSEGNVISAGTIDIAVNGFNPWNSTDQYDITGLEPSDHRDINVELSNVGTNDVVIWKKVKVASEADNLISEPECTLGGGTWTEGADTCTGSYVPVNDISSQFVYSMNIGAGVNIDQAWNVRVSDINDLWIPIGRLNAGGTLAVAQTYYFDEMAGNAYQGDSMTLDITFYAEQLNAPGPAHSTRGVVLENKDASGDWAPIVGDGTWGILTWDGSGNYTAKAWGLNAGTYQLDYFVDPSTNNFFGDTNTVGAGGSVNYSGTRASLTTDAGKYWLRDLSWNNTNTLWEANLVN